MKLTFKHDFTIETDDRDYKGTFADLTRKQIKAFEKKFKDSKLSDDELIKERLILSVEGDDKEEILALGETYNYKSIFDTIIQDINERKAKN